MTAAPRAHQGEFTGRHMWMLAIGFFGVIIGVNITLAVVSTTSWTGLVVENSYVASQEFEATRLAHEAQKAAGWQSSFSYFAGNAQLLVHDGAGQPIDLGPVTVQLNRPVGGHEDQTLLLTRAADGTYQTPAVLAPGVWEAMVTASSQLGPFELHERFKVEETRP